jgi:hypothetical protein
MNDDWIHEYLDSMYPDISNNLDEPIVMDEYPYSINDSILNLNFIDENQHLPVRGEPMSEDIIKQSPSTPWKYNEEEIVKELLEYIRGTYSQHYSAGDQKIQTLRLD